MTAIHGLEHYRLIQARAKYVDEAFQRMGVDFEYDHEILAAGDLIVFHSPEDVEIKLVFKSRYGSRVENVGIFYPDGHSMVYTREILLSMSEPFAHVEHHNSSGQFHNLNGPARISFRVGSTTYQHFHNDSLHNPTGAAIRIVTGTKPTKEEYCVYGEYVEKRKARYAVSPDTRPVTLAKYATGNDPHLAYLAAHNPNCPDEAKTAFSLLYPSM